VDSPLRVNDCFGASGSSRRRHEDINVLEDAARGDADYAVGRLDQVVTFATAMLTAKMIDEAEGGIELFGVDQEACAVGLPFF